MTETELKQLLHDHHINITQKRLVILKAIFSYNGIFNALELHNKILETSDIDVATIYRFLPILFENNIIREIINDNNIHYYELAHHNQNHPHFKCNTCQKIQCLNPLNAKENLSIFETFPDLSVTEVSILIKGICSDCKKEQ